MHPLEVLCSNLRATSAGLVSLVVARVLPARVPRKTWPKPPLPSFLPVWYTGDDWTWT